MINALIDLMWILKTGPNKGLSENISTFIDIYSVPNIRSACLPVLWDALWGEVEDTDWRDY